MRRATLAIVLIFILAMMSVASWFVYGRIHELEYRIEELQTRNAQLEEQNSNLQGRLEDLQGQVSQLTSQVSAMSSVKISDYRWDKGFYMGGLSIGFPVNVAILNNGTIDVNGLSLTVKLVYVASGTEFGEGFTEKIDILHANETQWVSGEVYAAVGSFSSGSAVCVITLRSGAFLLDQWEGKVTPYPFGS